ncbi:MAG TPA: choice-of-anchor tandem repeat GloVer-containing protein, partial [Candidatus Acidoferrales bacterium]|nr:choice-of-anchor tandem repeat GloVer-containing protein [Candidatus Acidoferrales bacterium]
DGGNPYANLAKIGSTLYGTTFAGGANGTGVAFKMSKKGVETVLHAFGSGIDGAAPYAGLIVVSGKLYGTTVNGGKNGAGTAFSMTTSGTEKVLVNYGGAAKNAANPWAALTSLKGALYGTTRQGGGSAGNGTVTTFAP